MNEKVLQIVLGMKDKLSPGLKGAAGKIKAPLAGLTKGFLALGAAIVAAFATRKIFQFMKQATEAAIVQERAIVGLNAALAATGQFTEEASRALQDYASSLQQTLGIGDEVTLQTLAQVEAITKLSAEALPDAMQAIIQISELYSVDFQNAGILLAKTLTSNLNAFSRYGIEVDLAGDATERLRQILDATSAGMALAEAKMKTFEGQTIKLKNAWGDFLEAVGRYITESPRVIATVGFLADEVLKLTNRTDEANESGQDLVGQAFVAIVDGGLETLKVILKLAQGMNQFAIGIFSVLKADRQLTVSTLTATNLFGIYTGKINEAKIAVEAYDLTITDLTANFDALGGTIDDISGAQDRLSEIIANIPDDVNKVSNSFSSLATAADTVTTAVGGAGGMNEALTESLILFGLMNDAARGIGRTLTEGQIGFDPALGAARDAPFGFGVKKKGGGRRSGVRAHAVGGGGGGVGLFGQNDFLMNLLGAGIGGAASGGGAGAASSILPILGLALGGPVGGAIGGFLGGLFGKKKKRGDTPSQPVFVSDVNTNNLLTELLNIVGVRAGGSRLDAIDAQLNKQSLAAGHT